MMCYLRQPETDDDFRRYYHFRWQRLRAPWNQPEGSEQDAIEEQSFHVMAENAQREVIGCGRLQFNSAEEAQVRYMAVDERYERKGVGRKMMVKMEQYAVQHGIRTIILNAREPAVGFYRQMGYCLEGESYLLFGEIQHYFMVKTL